ncbi:MAG: hypothetical protein ABIO61_06685 [Thermomonas sp.]
MNEEHPQIGEAALKMALRGLRQDVEPANDLWPGIAARLQAPAQASGNPPARVVRSTHRPWLWPLAVAASLIVAVGLAWQLNPSFKPTGLSANAVAQVPHSKPSTNLVAREADSLTTHYEAALREMTPESVPASWKPGIEALDRSAVEIRIAMQHDPNSRLLLQQLRSTYTRRLALARRALYA